MRLLHSVCVEIGALVPTSTSGCLSSGVNVVLQKVVGHSSDETPVVFDRYWASDTTQALVVERLPEPFMTSNIRDCATFIVREAQRQCAVINRSMRRMWRMRHRLATTGLKCDII
ncbi:hypothetical protein FHG87_022594 [Trinorchestia longiramus]|nr:hypothetical protein FHG87_022594 [Trinorchestia longiramus]